MVAGVQLAELNQSLDGGLRFQVALPALASEAKTRNKKAPLQSRARRNNRNRLVGVFIDWFLLGVFGTAMMLSQPPFFYLVSAEKGKFNRCGFVLVALPLVRLLHHR
jgi:hypothetical protein